MNWLNDMILDLQRKVWGDNSSQTSSHSTWNKVSEQESKERLHQFQSRLQDLDKRILELR
ncbi:MAG: hypothetical protein JXX29_09225 [Deltaproteobacteria bacterium]|nr:hypothetical protein [Deltaproteobacteria bacterium]MBN2671844.1 hypothetical protein [Deltaproteobacteria bacterium]